MGLADVFGKDDVVEVKVNDLLSYFREHSRGAVEAEMLKRGIKAGIPLEYLKSFITGEPVVVELPEACECFTHECGEDYCELDLEDDEDDEDEEPGVEVMFQEVNDVTATTDEGEIFVLTERGYKCTPERIRDERAVGKPVKGFEYRVPLSWLDKGYVVMVEEGSEDEKPPV